ncbi:hypothetical protein ANCCEY_15351, partial [Ancylostoma ceylanicum]
MIDTALNFLRNEVEQYLELVCGNTVNGDGFIVLSNVASKDGDWAIPSNKIGMSLINIEEERILKDQGKNVFTPDNSPGMDPVLQKLIVDIYSYSFEQQYNFWSILGAKYLPSVLYKDFTVVPVPETVRWLKDNNMLFRNDDTGFRIFYTADTGSTLLEPFTSFEAERLRFMLILNDPGRFFNITDLTIEGHPYKPGNILEFVNKGVNLDFDKQLILKSEPQVFTYQFPQQSGASSDIGKLEVFNERGEQVAIGNSDPEIHYPNPDEILPDANNNFVYPMDLTGYPTGIYRFKSYVNNTNEQERSMYMDGKLQKMNVFAMIHIDLKASSILF